ncbi:MAG TPA: hypothetical protein PKV73_11385 [Agriterribacter sp.]|nr:hypothetical protein [Chitinophagaceae bacterium]HRP32490.1 hypothetical protein [Agriterribacter sp.]
MLKKIIIFFGVVVLCLGVAWYWYSMPRRGVLHKTAEVSVPASELYDVYQSDEAEANQRFLDKIMEVDGTVEEIIWVGSDVVIMLGVGAAGGISCRFSPGTEMKNTEFKKGMKVLIKGKCTGFNIDVNLVDCVIVSKQAEP